MSGARGLVAAAIIGLVVSLTANGAKRVFTNYEPEPDEWLAYLCLAALPFAVLSLVGERRPAPWLTGLVLTACIWGAYIAVGVPQLASEGSIDMGLGVATGSSPVWITGACLLVRLFGRAPERFGSPAPSPSPRT